MSKVYKYDPVIYPTKLWVSNSVIGLEDEFLFCSLDDLTDPDPRRHAEILMEEDSGTVSGMTIPVIHQATREMGALVIIGDDEEDLENTIPHEALHVTDYIYEYLNLTVQPFADNENQAYLLGWVAKCISNAVIKLRKGNDCRRKQEHMEDRKG